MYNQMKQTISWLEYFTSAAEHGRRRFWLMIFVLYSLNTPAMCTRSLGVKKTDRLETFFGKGESNIVSDFLQRAGKYGSQYCDCSGFYLCVCVCECVLLCSYCMYLSVCVCRIRLLRVPSFRLKSFGQRKFSLQASVLWNSLPISLRHSNSTLAFRSALKTHLFPSQ